MSYKTHADIVESQGLRRRLVACAASEGLQDPPPASWVASVVWSLPTVEWYAAWESAHATSPGGDHGSDPLVITDEMILAAVQPLLPTPAVSG